ncbi:Hypothetical predicted protein [Olea europaea subsp. europaea]|uniref:Uncharacterized protein n=1 Tax=Olea europaea subsp. europaea TaxID=158383 RepID=A0A8S0PN78_OLEEU|nr:Hypothetical predicted protein [Olea europaea subsp. europaea]
MKHQLVQHWKEYLQANERSKNQQKHSEAAFERTQEEEDGPISNSNSKGQEIGLLDKNQAIEAGEKEDEKFVKAREQAFSSIFEICSPKTNTIDEDDAISEAPTFTALEKKSTQQVHNLADQQKQSEIAFEKTQK